MTKAEFRKKAIDAFKKQNPTATVGWLKQPRWITYPTGVEGWHWEFFAKAKGHRESLMLAEGDETYVMVRTITVR
jgi:hypothetical protein